MSFFYYSLLTGEAEEVPASEYLDTRISGEHRPDRAARALDSAKRVVGEKLTR